jgi:hypothetical protein
MGLKNNGKGLFCTFGVKTVLKEPQNGWMRAMEKTFREQH